MMSKPYAQMERGPAQKAPRPLSKVDWARPDDAEALITFLYSVRSEIDRGMFDDAEMETVARELANLDHGVAFIVRGPDGIEASLGLKAIKATLSRTRRLHVAWFAVLPGARLTGHAKSLLLTARSYADRLGRHLVAEESLSGDEPKTRLVARHIPPSGHIFSYAPAALETIAVPAIDG